MDLKLTSICLFFLMFLYSGYNKIISFNKKVFKLQKISGLPHSINVLGMILVILLEIVGSLIIISYFVNNKLISKKIVKYVNILFLLFLIVVTFMYHPPTDKIIPFLSNVTTFAGLLYIYSDLD